MLNLALLTLRLTTGGLLAGHGAQKLFGAFGGPGLEGTGEYFDANFSLGGGGYYLQAIRTVEDGESFNLGRFETTRRTLASGLPGSFDPAADTVSVTLPAQLWTDLGLPGIDGLATLGARLRPLGA